MIEPTDNLFEYGDQNNEQLLSTAPLASRMRPESLEEFLGQDKVLGPGRPLRKWIEADRVPSLILWGPPGCGKTTLAKTSELVRAWL